MYRTCSFKVLINQHNYTVKVPRGLFLLRPRERGRGNSGGLHTCINDRGTDRGREYAVRSVFMTEVKILSYGPTKLV